MDDYSVMLFLACLSTLLGSALIYHAGKGEIGSAKIMRNQIYRVSGQVATSKGLMVVIVEDSEGHPYTSYAGTKESPDLLENTKFVRITLTNFFSWKFTPLLVDEQQKPKKE